MMVNGLRIRGKESAWKYQRIRVNTLVHGFKTNDKAKELKSCLMEIYIMVPFTRVLNTEKDFCKYLTQVKQRKVNGKRAS